jgi:hypothetical protein
MYFLIILPKAFELTKVGQTEEDMAKILTLLFTLMKIFSLLLCKHSTKI